MIEIQITAVIMISILSSALIMRMKVQLITYQRDQCSLNRSLNDRQADLYTLCLFDSGSTNTLINQRLVPPDIPAKSGRHSPLPLYKEFMRVQKY